MNGNAIYKRCFLPLNGEKTTCYWWQGSLVGLSLGEQAHEALERSLLRGCRADTITDCVGDSATAAMVRLEQELTDYYGGKYTEFTVPIILHGTPFQKKVWEALLRIPYGGTACYSDLAVQAGVQGARATGSAVGANPIAIVVPCHRILPKSGKPGNYSTGRGPQTKKALLALEAGEDIHWR